MQHDWARRLMSAVVIAATVAAAAVGCDGTNLSGTDGAAGDAGSIAGSSGGGAAGAAGAGAAGAAGAGAAGAAGAVGAGGAGGAGNGAGQGGAAGAGGRSDDRLLPLEVGRTWMYQQTAPDPSMASNCARAEANVTGTAVDGSDNGWIYRPTCSDVSFDFFMSGDDIWRYPAGNHAAAERFQYASAPVQEGFNWMSGTDRFTWHDAGAVQTPAGRFDRCWQRAAQSGAYIILCRGVGLVVTESVASNYRLELAAKNF